MNFKLGIKRLRNTEVKFYNMSKIRNYQRPIMALNSIQYFPTYSKESPYQEMPQDVAYTETYIKTKCCVVLDMF